MTGFVAGIGVGTGRDDELTCGAFFGTSAFAGAGREAGTTGGVGVIIGGAGGGGGDKGGSTSSMSPHASSVSTGAGALSKAATSSKHN